MPQPADILTLADIKLLVDTFYDRIRTDALLAPIFNQRIQNNWPQHLDKMYRFWQTIMLEERTYFDRPFPPHAQLPIDEQHFTAWLALFNATVEELFTGDKADEAKWRANKMAQLFEAKLTHLRTNPFNIL